MSARRRGKEMLAELEQQVRGQGVKLSYEKLQFGGLRLKSGLCWFKGKYYLFVDRYKPVGERIDLLEQAIDELATLPEASQGPPEGLGGEAPAQAEGGEPTAAEDGGVEVGEKPAQGGEPPAEDADKPADAAPGERDA